MRQHLTPDQIREALACIPADLPREEWARVAMAIKSELGDGGFDLFNEWSASGKSYDATAARDTWRSITASGRVTIGTLLHLAKQHGYRPAQHAPQPALSRRQRAAQAAERARRDVAERAARKAAQDAAAALAVRLWSEASDTGESPYLAQKGCGAHGVRFLPDERLLIPMRTIDGELRNLQTIAPARPANGPQKRFLKGGQKTGLLHWLGDPAGADALLVCEGYATAASLYEATGRPVACAFDSTNLPHIARALRQHFGPQPLLLIAGDNDFETEQRTGKNAGRIAADKAARLAHGAVVLPETAQGQNIDFNDVVLSAGFEVVKARIEQAIAQARAAAPPGDDLQHAQQEPAAAPPGDDLQHAQQEPAAAPPGDDLQHAQHVHAAVPGHDRFSLNERGVWFAEMDAEGRPKAPLWICSPLRVTARTRDGNGGDWGFLLEFDDPAGHPRQWAAPAKLLAGDGAEFRAALLSMGLRISTAPRARQLLATYVQSRNPDAFARCVDRLGWHPGGVYVLHDEVLGNASERLIFQSEAAAENTLRQRGTLAQWRDRIAAYAVGNSRLVFAISAAFAGMALRPSAESGGGFHLVGHSSSGKSTALRVAASIYGPSAYAQNWRATSNAIEGTAAAHCDRLLILDEIAQIDAREVGECSYMLSNGVGKSRASRTGLPRPRLTWLLMLLSAGEVGIAQHMLSANKTARAGQELRLVDLPADAGAGMGLFERLHDRETPQALASYLGKAADAYHGTAARAFLEHCVSRADTLRPHMREAVERLAMDWIPDAASGQVHRVGRRFAVVGAAGELATAAGITGWPAGEAERAARRCFNDWLAARGGLGNSEDRQQLAQVRRFLELHGEGRFTDWARADDDHAPRTLSRAGFRKAAKDVTGSVESWDYFVLPETFRREVCDGFDYRAVLRVLRDKNHLQTDKGRAFDRTVRLPGLGRAVVYHILPSIFEGDDEA